MDLLHFKNGDRIIEDAYDDWVKLKLVTLEGKEIVIYDDTQLYLRDIYIHYFLNTKIMELDDSLKNADLGIMLNTYYYSIANDMELDENLFHLDAHGDWIGDKYACFENNNMATWIYYTNDRFVLKCSPLCEGLFHDLDDYDTTFKEFIRNYKEEYENYLSCQVYREFMHNLNILMHKLKIMI